jgi:hypothetical protein
VSKQDEDISEEIFAEAKTMLAVECPDADLTVIPGMGEAYDAGVWFGMAATYTVLERHGIIPAMPPDGESRE